MILVCVEVCDQLIRVGSLHLALIVRNSEDFVSAGLDCACLMHAYVTCLRCNYPLIASQH